MPGAQAGSLRLRLAMPVWVRISLDDYSPQ
jgi:hypothetical protein